MRHRKDTANLGKTSSHKRCMIANMLKNLIYLGRIETTVPKAKELRRTADRMVTLAKRGTLAGRREAVAELMIRYNSLTNKEQRLAKEGNQEAYNIDRQVMGKLYDLATRFATRQGGYTRIIKSGQRTGDNTELCVIEYLSE